MPAQLRNIILIILALGLLGSAISGAIYLGDAVGETVNSNAVKLANARAEKTAIETERAANESLATEFLKENPEYSALASLENANVNGFEIRTAIENGSGANVDMESLPSLLRGQLPSQSLSTTSNAEKRVAPPRMCEMPEDYFDNLERPNGDAKLPGYTDENGYVRSYKPRRGFLNEREIQAAKVAWGYFEQFTQESTGLANSVGGYPSTTLWDTASYISGLVAAYELCLIEKPQFDKRIMRLLTTFRKLKLFRNEMPNKVYHTKTAAQVDYSNKPGEIGYSALDIGRFMVWMRIIRNRYPYLANTIDNMLLRWDYSNIIDEDGVMFGAAVDKETKETIYAQEGRLGYEEYAAKGFALWGFKPYFAHRAEPYLTTNILDVRVPYDGRDPRVFHSQNYVVTESYLLDGLELNWDLLHDDASSDTVHSDGWRAEFADRIYQVQHNRFERDGYMTARSEHNVKGPPYFTYDTIYSDGYPWNTVTPRGDYSPDHAAVATKAAFGLWALWDTYYTDILYEAVIELFDPERGFYEGLYEGGTGHIEIQTANNNGILLASLLHKVQGRILTGGAGGSEVWYTRFRDRDVRIRRKLPDPPQQADWLPAYRHPAQMEETQ
ncbi:hypothetical protein GCM10008927_22350 [Amylibacter ulvae]|uniref:DUF3131 domain-containing protein n=1 Tax=Paramylibacter ulvae TaxID=1651968 RepID=A0ABQ3D4D3_9RHOB|nr:DUF3131 domain-containing protein [Amylibacter ulvae]GHA56143.1 hypothetical protein GCM10008927_22350 [Amylibacter ulvae]